MLTPQDVPNVFDKLKIKNEIRALKRKIRDAESKDKRTRAVDKIDAALRIGKTCIYFWDWELSVEELLNISSLYRGKGWGTDIGFYTLRNYIEFKP